MLFNSLEFLIFFPVVTMLYFLLPHSWRWAMLLIASCVFYMYFIPIYILILFFTIIIDYIAGILIADAEGAKRKRYLAMSIVANVGVLAVFKYFNFFEWEFRCDCTSHPLELSDLESRDHSSYRPVVSYVSGDELYDRGLSRQSEG